MNKRKDIILRRSEIEEWCKNKVSKAEICKRLKCNFITLDNYLKKWGIVYKGHQDWRKGQNFKSEYVPYVEYIAKGGMNRTHIKNKLLREGLKEAKCECCGNTEWLGKPIPLELHHEDGIQSHTELSNLKLLCPNCHHFTDNYSGRKKINIKFCPICGKPVSKKGTHCKQCAAIKRGEKITKRPEKDKLKKDLFMYKNFTKIGKKYNVSDNAVRKWCKFYGLPYHSKDL